MGRQVENAEFRVTSQNVDMDIASCCARYDGAVSVAAMVERRRIGTQRNTARSASIMQNTRPTGAVQTPIMHIMSTRPDGGIGIFSPVTLIGASG